MLTLCAGGLVGLSLALLSEPRPDRLSTRQFVYPGHPGARARRHRRPRRDRHLARLDRSPSAPCSSRNSRRRRADLDRGAAGRRRLRAARHAQRRARRPARPALAGGDARHDGRLPRPRLHHRLGDRLHRVRRRLHLHRLREALGRAAGLLPGLPRCVALGDRLPDAPHGVRPALLCGRQQQAMRPGSPASTWRG